MTHICDWMGYALSHILELSNKREVKICFPKRVIVFHHLRWLFVNMLGAWVCNFILSWRCKLVKPSKSRALVYDRMSSTAEYSAEPKQPESAENKLFVFWLKQAIYVPFFLNPRPIFGTYVTLCWVFSRHVWSRFKKSGDRAESWYEIPKILV